ncbi:MAG: PDZ domain-containing protein [Acidimicrobiales bacterium]
MTEAFRDFDESFDDDEPSRLLPPEDRIWRHPSELRGDPPSSMAAEVSAAREKWLSRTPTRAGAWSAGVVGAVLATGVVLVGTHLTVWLGRSPAPARTSTVATTLTPAPSAMTTALDSIAGKVHHGLAVIEVSKPGGRSAVGDGVVMSSDGKIIVPLSLVLGGSAIAVHTSDGAVYAGRVIGTDQATQLAVVSIGLNASHGFKPLRYSTQMSIQPGDWLAVEWSAISPSNEDQSVFTLGSAGSSSTASTAYGSYQLLNTLHIETLAASGAPVGTVLVNGSAQLVGIVTGHKGNVVVEVSALLAEQVGQQIAEHGRVVHGWLGIQGVATPDIQTTGDTLPPTGKAPLPPGVEVLAVGSGSSAARAGLRTGDVIEAVNGRPVASMQALQQALYVLPPRSKVALTIDRRSSLSTVDALLQPAA